MFSFIKPPRQVHHPEVVRPLEDHVIVELVIQDLDLTTLDLPYDEDLSILLYSFHLYTPHVEVAFQARRMR